MAFVCRHRTHRVRAEPRRRHVTTQQSRPSSLFLPPPPRLYWKWRRNQPRVYFWCYFSRSIRLSARKHGRTGAWRRHDVRHVRRCCCRNHYFHFRCLFEVISMFADLRRLVCGCFCGGARHAKGVFHVLIMIFHCDVIIIFVSRKRSPVDGKNIAHRNKNRNEEK